MTFIRRAVKRFVRDCLARHRRLASAGWHARHELNATCFKPSPAETVTFSRSGLIVNIKLS